MGYGEKKKRRSDDRLCARYFPICQTGCLFIAYYWVLSGVLEFAPVSAFGYLFKNIKLVRRERY